MNATQILAALQQEAANRAYIIRFEILDQRRTLLKVRLFMPRGS
jgi:hypothetical protein